MPNAKVLEEKKALVASLVEKIKNSPAGVLVDYKGINVEDDTKLRRQLREAGVEYAVIKNTLIRFAAKELGFEALDDHGRRDRAGQDPGRLCQDPRELHHQGRLPGR